MFKLAAEKDHPYSPDDSQTKIIAYFDKIYNSDFYQKIRKEMDEHYDLFEGKLWSDNLDESESRAQVNYIFSSIQTLAPLITDNKPVWYIRARDPMFQNLAALHRLALDYLWDSQELEQTVSLAVLDSLIQRAGIVKIFYDEDISYEIVDPRSFIIAP
jgi:hypothetical protein